MNPLRNSSVLSTSSLPYIFPFVQKGKKNQAEDNTITLQPRLNKQGFLHIQPMQESLLGVHTRRGRANSRMAYTKDRWSPSRFHLTPGHVVLIARI